MSAVAPLPADDVVAWSDEVDVLVIGAGMAGTSAALEAAAQGARVLVIDRGGRLTCTSAMSGGHFLAGKTVTYVYEGASMPQLFIPRLIDLWQRGVFPFDRLVRTYPLAEIDTAEADTKAGTTIKPVLLMPDRGALR